MKNYIILIALFGFFQTAVNAQISNVKTRVSEEQDKVTITYDLNRDPKITFYNIQVKITLDGEVVNATGLSGDVGPQVTAGLGKKIQWDVSKDLSELSGELKVEVSTNTKAAIANCRPINAVPAYAGLGAVELTGLGVLISGLSVRNNSQELYDYYKANLNPQSSAYPYEDLTRDELYDEANKKNKNAQLLMSGGGAVMLVGGAIYVVRLIKIKRYNAECDRRNGFGHHSKFQIQPTLVGNWSSPGMGLGLSYRF